MPVLNDFCHLHLHSTYSILDGENQLDAIIKQVKVTGMKQVALTDHGTMMGSLNFYKACKKEGIKPVIGVEAYITGDIDDLPKDQRTRDNNHLVIIAQNETGYKNLLKLVSKAQLSNFHFKPRISKHNLIPANTEGLVATSACLGGETSRSGKFDQEKLVYTDLEAMEATAKYYSTVFNDRFYLELQDNDDTAGQQKQFNQIAISLGKKLGIKTVITSDAHYTKKESADVHSMIMAMQLKKTLADYQAAGEMKYGPWFYIRAPEEMLIAAKKYGCEEAFWNTCELAASCNLEIEIDKYQAPVFDIKSDPDYEEFLRSRHVHED